MSDMEQLATEVAEHMDGWKVGDNPHNHGAYLDGPDGARVFLRVETYGSNKGKLDISGTFHHLPGYSNGNGDTFLWDEEAKRHVYAKAEIGVSVSRGAAVIAREIERRLLPVYLPLLARVQESIARRLGAKGQRDALGEELAGLIGGRWDSERAEASCFRGKAASGDFKVMHNADSLTVELHSVTPDQARAIARLIFGE